MNLPERGQFRRDISEAMQCHKISTTDLARRVDSNYAYMHRVLTNNSTFPSKYLLREISRVLSLDFTRMTKSVAADKISIKYGGLPSLIADHNPELEPFRKHWHILSTAEKELIIDMTQNFLRQHKKRRRASD